MLQYNGRLVSNNYLAIADLPIQDNLDEQRDEPNYLESFNALESLKTRSASHFRLSKPLR